MAGTHGVKRPGGSALNAGQVGGLRAAEYIVNAYGCEVASGVAGREGIDGQVADLIAKLDLWGKSSGPAPQQVIEEIQDRMTASAAHIREAKDADESLRKALLLYKAICEKGLAAKSPRELTGATQAEHLALCSVAHLKAIADLLAQGGGSRGSYLVLSPNGTPIHPDVVSKATGEPLTFKPENRDLRNQILEIQYDETSPDLFKATAIPLRQAPVERKAFEPAWQDYRDGRIYRAGEPES